MHTRICSSVLAPHPLYPCRCEVDSRFPLWPHPAPSLPRFALATVGVLAAASGALLALRRALGSGRLDPARPSGLHHTTAQEVCDGLWGELTEPAVCMAVAKAVEEAKDLVAAVQGCPCAGSGGNAASSDSSSRCNLGVGNWCLQHSPSYLLLLSRASRFAHDIMSLAACGGGAGPGAGTSGSAGAGSGNSSNSSSLSAEDAAKDVLHALSEAALLAKLCDALLAVPPLPPSTPSAHQRDTTYPEGPQSLSLPDDPSRNLPPHVATCLTVSICHVASCCCMLASSEVLGKDTQQVVSTESSWNSRRGRWEVSVTRMATRVLSGRLLHFIGCLQQQAMLDVQRPRETAGRNANSCGGGNGGNGGSSSSGWAALNALRLQRRLGVWLGSQGLSVLQTGLGEAGGAVGQGTAHGLPAVSGSASAHPGAVRAVTHLLLVAPYLMIWGALVSVLQGEAAVTVEEAGTGRSQTEQSLSHEGACAVLRALHATWQLHTSHLQLRLPLPGEPQLPPPVAASTANTRSGTAAAAAAPRGADTISPLAWAYVARTALPLCAVDPARLAKDTKGKVALRLVRVEMIGWALAGATGAAEAWLRRTGRTSLSSGEAEQGCGVGQGQVQAQGQGRSGDTGFAGTCRDLVALVGQLVEEVHLKMLNGGEGGC